MIKLIKKSSLVLILFCCFSVGALEKKKLPILPSDFLYENQPIEPACFYQLVGEESNKEINLSTHVCQNTTTEFDAKQISDGLLGYHLVDEAETMSLPYIYYRLIGQKEPKTLPEYYVELQWSGGGTGNFKELILVQKKQNKLKLLETIASGDRCFGGVTHIDYNNQQLKYAQNLTSADFGRQLGFNETEIEKLGLKDCAICCIGLLHQKNGKIQGMSLNAFDQEDVNNIASACFSQTLFPLLGTHQKELSLEAAKDLAKKIRQACL